MSELKSSVEIVSGQRDPIPTTAAEDAPGGFEGVMLQFVNEFEAEANRFLGPYWSVCRERREQYRTGERFVSLRQRNEFPMPIIQKNVDVFVATARDKLFYAGRPVRVLGREEEDKADAEARQQMLDYQDEIDKIYLKSGLWLRDAALLGMPAALVNYCEEYETVWEEVPEEAPLVDASGQPVTDEHGFPIGRVDELGNPVYTGEKRWERVKKPRYLGAETVYLKPEQVLFTQDKQEVDDEFPIAVRTSQSEHHFRSKSYYRKVDDLAKVKGETTGSSESDARRARNSGVDAQSKGRPYTYVECYAYVDKASLYEFMVGEHDEYVRIKKGELYAEYGVADDGEPTQRMISVESGERCWAIVGVVNRKVVVRLEPCEFGRPPVVLGFMCADGVELYGLSLADKIVAAQIASDEMMGYLLENIKQSINAFWLINTNLVENKEQLVNKTGGIFYIQGPPDSVMKRVEQPRVAPDIYTGLRLFDEIAQDGGGGEESVQGKGDPNAETLGEFQETAMQAMLRMRDYLKTLEDSFFKPLYHLRNDINALFIDKQYAYEVLGDAGIQIRHLDPSVIRRRVQFKCEAAARETKRAVLVQQILQLVQVAPLTINAGQPVRIDKLVAELCEFGFGWAKDKIEQYLPLIAHEQVIGVEEVNRMLAENALLQQAINRLMMMSNVGQIGMVGGGGQPASPRGAIPRGTSESDVAQANMQRGRTVMSR